MLVLGSLMVLGAGVTALLVPRPGQNEISPESALKLQRPLWVDARGADDFAQGAMPGALLLNEDNWPRSIATVLEQWHPGRPIIVYCGSLSCSASQAVAKRLRGEEYGLAPVYVLRGGWDVLKARLAEASQRQ
jgi:rhodanese-related sulfurtransferase